MDWEKKFKWISNPTFWVRTSFNMILCGAIYFFQKPFTSLGLVILFLFYLQKLLIQFFRMQCTYTCRKKNITPLFSAFIMFTTNHPYPTHPTTKHHNQVHPKLVINSTVNLCFVIQTPLPEFEIKCIECKRMPEGLPFWHLCPHPFYWYKHTSNLLPCLGLKKDTNP